MTAPRADSRSLALALASEHPQASLPCPACAASVKGVNLASHLERTHAGAAVESRDAGGLPTWRGVDRGSRGALLGLAVSTWVLVVLLIGVGGVRDDLGAGVLVTIGVVAFVPGLLSIGGLIPATLELDGERLRLRRGLGLLVREVRLTAPLETGGLRGPALSALGTNAGAPESAPVEEVAVGRYLRARDGSRSITVSAAKGTALEKHWAPQGWRASGPARTCDIAIDRAAMAQLEHHLASRGLLTPRDV